MGLKKSEALKEKGCHTCGQEIAELSQTLPLCLDCLRSGKETVKPFIEKAHHRSRISFRLVTLLHEMLLVLLARFVSISVKWKKMDGVIVV